MAETTSTRHDASVDPAEVGRFEAMAEAWWDEDGPQRPLHRLNPVRMEILRDWLIAHFTDRDAGARRPLAGLDILDVGCGGGLVTEPLARLGANVTGIDAGVDNVAIARAHGAAMGLEIDYRAETAEALLAAGEAYDVVVSLEVVEHVADVAGFLAACAGLVRPGGAAIFATLNRTARSLALGIVAAEYVLCWVPRGTHDWRRFVRPAELRRHLAPGGLVVDDLAGIVFDPRDGEWRWSRDTSVNYMALATRRPDAKP